MKRVIDGIEVEVRKLTQWWVTRDTSGITLRGVIYLRNLAKADDEEYLRHEAIHILQQKELGYLRFLIKYVWLWIFKGEKNIHFEREAYKNENNIGYLSKRQKNEWKKYR